MTIKKITKKINRMVAMLVVAIMCMTIFADIPVIAETWVSIFDYSNYIVEYAVVNEWDGYQNIEIKLTNTGIEPIYNWALKYNAGGEISNLWNGIIFDNDETNYIIKNSGYNYEIMPGESISFGYTLNGDDLTVPDSIENCAERVEITDGCYIQLVTEDEWDGGFTGYIEILNKSEETFEAWMLSFDMNFTVTDLWNAAIIENKEYSYKVSSQIMSNPIQPGDSVRIGIAASYDIDITPEITNKIFTAVKIDDNFTAEDNDKGSSDNNIHDDSDEFVGKIYFKDISSTDDFIYDSDGNCYFKNQVLLTAYDNVSFEKVKELADSLNAEIVGYIELTNDYQIEFKNDIPIDELLNTVEMLSTNPFFELVTPNIIFKIDFDDSENAIEYLPADMGIDPLTDINKYNWNLHAINVIDPWQYYLNPNIPTSAVKVGVIDDYIYNDHKDLKFSKIWNVAKDGKIDHGMLVAGIIGAEHNNTGMAGICPGAELYGFSYKPGDIDKWSSVMIFKYSLALMIGNNVKVINASINIPDDIDGTKHIEKTLNKLLKKGYDFLIVCSAGNNAKDAKDNSFFTYIDSSSPVYEHIIVVGAVNYKKAAGSTTDFLTDSDGNIILEYEYRTDINYGGRVDIVAPGEDNASTSIGPDKYRTISRTSGATPHVSGVAGLIYSVNPRLKAREVKNIIIESAKESAKSNEKRKIIYSPTDKNDNVIGTYTYYLLDAKAAVDMALDQLVYGPFPPSIDRNELSIVYGTVTNENDEPVSATIYAMPKGVLNDVINFKADSDGTYLITLQPGTYTFLFIDFSKRVEITTPIFGNFYGWNNSSTYVHHVIYDKEIEAGEAYPLDIMLDNSSVRSVKFGIYGDSNGKDLADIEISITNANNSEVYKNVLNSDGFSYVDVDDGEYTISVSKFGYVTQILNVIASGGILYDENGNVFEKILLMPIKSTITGTVTEHNITTGKIKPKANHTVTILQDESVIASGITDSNGIYEIVTDKQGDIIVDAGKAGQKSLTITYDNDEYTADFMLITEDDDDEEDDDNNDQDDDDNDSDDQGYWEHEIDGEVIFTMDNPESSNLYGGNYFGDLSSGIWLETKTGYHIRIYIDNTSGEYTSSLVAAGWGYPATGIYSWKGELKIAVYDEYNNFLFGNTREYVYNDSELIYQGVRDHLETSKVVSISVNSNGFSYTVHTDGDYISYSNIAGATGFRKEKWEDDYVRSLDFSSSRYGGIISISNECTF